MILYTSDDERLVFNNARNRAVFALEKTLDKLYGKEGVSERDFAKHWLELMSRNDDIYAKGWYDPPVNGMAVLVDERLCFDSLRNEEYWPSDKEIDWDEGFLYAYCSPVDRKSGYIGDMSVTLYFGDDEKVKEHFRSCKRAIRDIFDHLEEAETPKELYGYSLKAFERRGLLSNVISRTDSMPSNLGHTFTRLEDTSGEELSRKDIAQLSASRRFINAAADWTFEEGVQFTIEPQLLAAGDPGLYKVTHHYVVKKTGDGFIVCNDIDRLLERYGLI